MSPDSFSEMLEKHVADANKNITHADFVVGVEKGTIGFRCMFGEPNQLFRGARKIVFNVLVLLYLVAPLILVPFWAYHEGDWWLLFAIVISYVASFSAACKSNIIFLFACLSAGVWIYAGFSIHQYVTSFFFCALWGYALFRMADEAQMTYALQSLVENRALFEVAISQNRIMIVRKDNA